MCCPNNQVICILCSLHHAKRNKERRNENKAHAIVFFFFELYLQFIAHQSKKRPKSSSNTIFLNKYFIPVELDLSNQVRYLRHGNCIIKPFLPGGACSRINSRLNILAQIFSIVRPTRMQIAQNSLFAC